MKNHNKKVVVFTVLTTVIYFAYSLYITLYHIDNYSFGRISILSDIVKERNINKDSLPIANWVVLAGYNPIDTSIAVVDTFILDGERVPKDNLDTSGVKLVVLRSEEKNINNYNASRAITNFDKDTSKPALPNFMQKLLALKKERKQKVRIAWLGDSMIEGDLLTKTFRKKMQQLFGGYGVGFVPATSITAPFRTTVSHNWKGDWKEESFKTTSLSNPMFLSGHTFYTYNGELSLTDKTITDTNQILEKSLLCGYYSGIVGITVNGMLKECKPNNVLNRIVLDASTNHSIKINIRNNSLPVYGVSLEPREGIVVDNFSFRGITGLELGKIDSPMLASLQAENNYDLVVLEYGANLMFRLDDVDYSWYGKHINTVVAKLRKYMPKTEFLIISTADRAFKYEDKWRTAVGISNLIKTQADLAYKNNAAFFNMYESMGGKGTIVNWAESSHPLANKDYIHPNNFGADILGNILFDAFMNDFRKAGG